GTDSATELVKHFERFTPEAKWDVNHFRMGFGSDTTTDAKGRVGMVVEGASTTIEDATRDLARRVRVTQDELMNNIGDSWARLPAKVKAVLTSVAYNYGTLPKDIAAAAKTDNIDAISEAIAKHASDKPYTNAGRPVNERRRLEEAAIVASVNEEHEARAKISDELQKQRDIRAGGSAIDRAALETAREAANAGRDEVAARERSVAALEKQLNLTSRNIDRSKLETQLENERAALRQARAQKTAADASLKAAGTFQGTEEWEKYKLEAVDALQAVTKRGTAEWTAFEEQKTNISRQAEDYRDALAENALDRELQSRLAALKAEESHIKAAGERRNLTATEEIAALQSISDQRLEIQRAHYDKVAALYDGDKKKLAEVESEKTRIVDQNAVERANIQKSLAAKQEAEGKAFADSVASMSGSVLRAMQEHTSAADALRTSLRNILTQALENNVRVLAQLIGNATGFGRAFGSVMDGSLVKSQLAGKGIADGLTKPTEGVADGLQSTMSKAFESIKSMFSSVLDGMGSLLQNFLNSATGFLGSIFKGLGLIGGSLGSALPSFDAGSWAVPSGANVDGKGGFPALIH
ncbi:hypothetical protein, partial [Methylosinus sp. R-45379]|uniref:hypothetical protein n=1 Tax=Methylosinus sp. R-45379 TaxID=980563 RepID=UPI000AD4AE9C